MLSDRRRSFSFGAALRRPSLLLIVEATALFVWIGLAGWLVWDTDPRGEVLPIAPQALVSGASSETWMGIYFEGVKAGYSVSSSSPTNDGGQLLRSRSAFEVAAFGEIKRVVTVSNAVVGPDNVVRQFDFFMDSDPVRLTARGEVRADEIVIELVQAGELQTMRVDITEPPQMSVSLNAWIGSLENDLAIGQSYEVPYFDPITLSKQPMVLRIVDVELLPAITIDGVTRQGEEAYWVERTYGDIMTRALVTPDGQLIREEGALGLKLVRETREQAQTMPAGAEPVDIIALSSVKLTGGKLDDPRSLRFLELAISGVDPELIDHDPPHQIQEDKRVRMEAPLAAEIPRDVPVAGADEVAAEYTEPTPFLASAHPKIRGRAEDVAGDATDRRAAVEALNDHVYGYLIKAPTIGVPNALEVLEVGQGDCNEHTALFVALARSIDIPSRIAAGLVYSERIGSGGFYYHAWPEVWFGEELGWVAVDPTFGQFPADATHVKVVEGDLDKQIEIMGVMGRVGFHLIEAR
ncbi:MAG: transglutaminase domain-containing protein [Proteobacteria bacterium]|nr:transglutaminase domain-containing protein [Pseudomonadota bacterium]MCP4921391.1 transglutaminase domain-containing protein [Pseudomonadota bacterium]